MIELDNVSAFYGAENEILKKLNITLPDDRNVCILGNNGSGKTTLLRTINGFVRHTGEVKIDGKDINCMKRRDIAEHVSLMSQFSEVFFSYTVYDTVMLGRFVHSKGIDGIFGNASAEDREITEHCLEDTGMYDLKDRQISELSGGQLQRVLLARAFAQDTHIIMLDEPANHLDMKYQAELSEHLKKWSRVKGNMFIGVFHDIAMAAEAADDILCLKDGRIAAYGPVRDIMDKSVLESVYDMDVSGYMRKKYSMWQDI